MPPTCLSLLWHEVNYSAWEPPPWMNTWHIERDAALERRFQPIMVGEPTVEETIEILHGLRDRYEQHHKLKSLMLPGSSSQAHTATSAIGSCLIRRLT